MKKSLLLVIAFLISTSISLQAQIEKKDWLLGGSLSYNGSNYGSNSNYSNANFSPHIGYAVGKNAVLGLSFSVGYSDDASRNKSFDLNTNIFYKKFFPLKDKFGAYLQINGGIGWIKSSSLVLDSTGTLVKNSSTSHSYLVGAVPGVYYLISPGILLTADCGGLGYSYYTQGSDNWSSNFAFNFLSNFTFGVDFILGKKKS